jgi:DNA-binding SARP family transcriptional activator
VATTRLYLFGRFEAVAVSRPVRGLEARKIQELFSYLVLAKKRPIQREQLADRLWPNVDARRCKKYLRQALWQLQKVVADGTRSPGQQLLVVDQEWIEINPEADLWVDVVEFERAYELAIAAPAGEMCPEVRTLVRAAVELYRGELLEGWYHNWCLYPRDAYRSMYLALLDALMVDAEASGCWEAGLAYGRRALTVDRANERTYVRMMRLHCRAGNRTEALRQYDMCVTALQDELAVTPEIGTRQLHELIRDEGRIDSLSGPASALSGAHSLGVVGPPSDDSLGVLRELNRSLSQLQEELAGQIRALERQ